MAAFGLSSEDWQGVGQAQCQEHKPSAATEGAVQAGHLRVLPSAGIGGKFLLTTHPSQEIQISPNGLLRVSSQTPTLTSDEISPYITVIVGIFMKINLAKKLAAAALLIMGLNSHSYANILFTDNLQSASDLNALGAKTVGIIGTAQDGTKAMTFSALQAGSNLVSTKTYLSTTNSFTVSFDYFSSCGAVSNCGGFLATPGDGGHWTVSDTAFGNDKLFADAAKWQHLSYTYAGASTSAAFEIWNGSQHAKAADINGLGASFYIKDFVLTDNSVGAANGLVVTAVAAVPEPETYAMLLAGLGLMGAVVKRRKSNQV